MQVRIESKQTPTHSEKGYKESKIGKLKKNSLKSNISRIKLTNNGSIEGSPSQSIIAKKSPTALEPVNE